MWDTKTIAGRAERCVACHVGAPGTDVNHDLMAAGHPRLNFELGVYHANMPHHWDDAKDRGANGASRPNRENDRPPGSPDFEVRVWQIGQLVTAAAALDLLAARANKELNNPWPEFAEYDCFACHHSLQSDSWRIKKPKNGKKAGQYPWGTWYTPPTFPELLIAKENPQRATLHKALKEIRDLMEAEVLPDRAKAQKYAENGTKQLRALFSPLGANRFSRDQAVELFRNMAGVGSKKEVSSWDEAAQIYLALCAVRQGWKDLGPNDAPPPSIHKQLTKILRILQFDKDYVSPKATFQPRTIGSEFTALLDLVP
jgi:hypothetical protein